MILRWHFAYAVWRGHTYTTYIQSVHSYAARVMLGRKATSIPASVWIIIQV